MDSIDSQQIENLNMHESAWNHFLETKPGRAFASALAIASLASACAGTPESNKAPDIETNSAVETATASNSSVLGETLDSASAAPAEIKAMLPNEALVGNDALELIPESWLEVNSWAPGLLESLNSGYKEDGPSLDREAQIVFWRGIALSKNFAYDSPERLIMQNPMVIRRPSSNEMFLVSSILGSDEVYAGYYLGEYEKLYASREEGMMDTLFFPYPEQQNTGQYVVANIGVIHDSGYLGLYDLMEDELRDNQVTQYSFAVAINERSQIDSLVTNSSPNSAKWLAMSTAELSTDLLEYQSRNN